MKVTDEQIEQIAVDSASLKRHWASHPGDVPLNMSRYFEAVDIMLSALAEREAKIHAQSVVLDLRAKEAIEQRDVIFARDATIDELRQKVSDLTARLLHLLAENRGLVDEYYSLESSMLEMRQPIGARG